jgi:ketosteroid isomerase-like protein
MEGMRKILLSAVTLCLLTVPLVRGAAQEDSEAAQVKALDFKLTEAYKQRKFDLLASLLDDDFVIIFEDGNVYGKTGYISFSATSTIKVDVAEMTDVKVRMHGNTAILTGVYHEKGKDKGWPLRFSRPVYRCVDEGERKVAADCVALRDSGETVILVPLLRRSLLRGQSLIELTG